MPYINNSDTDRVDITLEGYPEEWVEMRKGISWGEIRSLGEHVKADLDSGTERLHLLDKMIVSWNVQNESGGVDDVDLDSLSKLDVRQINMLIDVAVERIQVPLGRKKKAISI